MAQSAKLEQYSNSLFMKRTMSGLALTDILIIFLEYSYFLFENLRIS